MICCLERPENVFGVFFSGVTFIIQRVFAQKTWGAPGLAILVLGTSTMMMYCTRYSTTTDNIWARREHLQVDTSVPRTNS